MQEIYTGKEPYPGMDAVRASTLVCSGKLIHPVPENVRGLLSPALSVCQQVSTFPTFLFRVGSSSDRANHGVRLEIRGL